MSNFNVHVYLDALNATKNNIKIYGQREPGVVTSDGIVVDGNRRFTCLRMLNKENPNDDRFKYFEAVILDCNDCDGKKLKQIEWWLQMGTEERVQYDPIDKMVDIFREIDVNKNFSIQEYSENTNTSLQDSKNLLIESRLLNDFLIRSKNKEKWYLAKKMKLAGALFEIRVFLSKMSKKMPDKEELYKQILFNILLLRPSKDMGKFIRNQVSKVLFCTIDNGLKKELEKFELEQEKIDKSINNCFDDYENDYELAIEKMYDINFEPKTNFINSLSNLSEEIFLSELKNKPFELMTKIHDYTFQMYSNIDYVQELDDIQKLKILSIIDDVIDKVNQIKRSIK